MMNMLFSAMSNMKPVYQGQFASVDSDPVALAAESGLQGLSLTASATNTEASYARYHSLLAMEAARKMRRTKLKQKTGQEVCHHLKMMLAEPLPEKAARAESQFQLGF